MFHRIFPLAIPTFRRSAAHCLTGIGLWVLALLLLVVSTHAFATPINLAWDPVSDADLAGYKLYYGYGSGQYSVKVNVGNTTTATLSGLDGAQIYYFAVTSYDTAGNESAFSNEVKYDFAAHDTDKDGLNNWDEISLYRTDPDRADTDGDGLSDGDEVKVYQTDPTRDDTDGDGALDGTEVTRGSNPLDAGSLPGDNAVVFAVNAGGMKYVGTDGTVYQADARFSGGSTDTKMVAITGTTDDPLYQSFRYGNFSYAVPVADGEYLVTLKFAENLWTQAGKRVFDVSIEGQVVLNKLDVFAMVGANAAYDVTLPVTVSDGVLTITFQPVVGNAMVSGIKVEPEEVVFAVNAGGTKYVGTDGTVYQADARFSGGSTDTKMVAITGTTDDPLYQSFRYGNFSYAVPVADGEYLVTLKFAENLWTQAGKRVFDVSIEGQVVLNKLDVFAMVGANAAYDVTLPVTVSDGVLTITFQPVVGNAMVSGIKVEPEEVVFAVNAGGMKYVGTDGTVYQADARFSGGSTDTKMVAITGTTDDPLYQSFRYGNFSYAVPVADGEYLVTLKFAENLWTQAGKRVFDVSIEGQVVLNNLDVFATVGANAAYDVTLPVTVSDGVLTITFQPVVGNAMVSGIKVEPKEEAFAVNAGGTKYVGTDGTVYQADARFSGGSTDTKMVAITGTTDDPLYQSFRYGNFSYAVPVADGEYLVTLKFAENLWTQAGKRVFDVSIEGQVVLNKLDVFAMVGANAAYDVTLPVTVSDGVLTITFQPVVGNAMVSGIVIVAM